MGPSTVLSRIIPQCRLYSTHVATQSEQIIYRSFGDPRKNLEIGHGKLHRQIMPGQVRVRWLASPINPADLNMIQGTYAIKPCLPAVGGNEGVAVVEQTGDNVVSMSVGDWVIPMKAALGTWQTHSLVDAHSMIKVNVGSAVKFRPNQLSLEAAATLMVNPPTAYRMLKDFVKLRSGDVVIQNGANSAVGRYVIQIANINSWQTVNVIRDYDDQSITDNIKSELMSLGATVVLTEKELRESVKSEKSIWNSDTIRRPKLALNCVGGDSTLSMASVLDDDAKLVTYGGMSLRPIRVSTTAFIFKRLQMHGYWMSHWYTIPQNHTEAIMMVSWLSDHILDGSIKTTKCVKVPYKDYQQAVNEAVNGSKEKKILIFAEH